MAYTPAGRTLTEAHRRAQSRIGSTLVAQVLSAWRLIDLEYFDRSSRAFLRVVVPLVVASRRESVRTASTYLTAFRAVEAPNAPRLTLPAPEPMDIERIRKSLIITGPGRLQGRVRAGDLPEIATRKAQVAVARAAQRQALDGGRERVLRAVESDRTAFGWARATSGSCCYFCAMLASRGAVYKSERTAGFDPHDGCNCEPEPIYRRAQPLPPATQGFAEQWADATEGLSGHDARLAFRRAYEGREAPPGWEPSHARTNTRPKPPKPGGASAPEPSPETKAERLAKAKAEHRALGESYKTLLARQEAGEDVSTPLAWQRDRMDKLLGIIRRGG